MAIDPTVLAQIRNNELISFDAGDYNPSQITDADMPALAEALSENTSIRILDLTKAALTDAALEVLAPTIEEMDGLIKIFVNAPFVSTTGLNHFYDRISYQGRKNLCAVDAASNFFTYAQTNRDEATILRSKLKDGSNFRDVSAKHIAQAHTHFHAVYDFPNIPMRGAESWVFFETLPVMGADDITCATDKEKLFAPTEKPAGEYTPLDNPTTWANLPAIQEALIEQGNPITKKDLLERMNRDDEPYLYSAIYSGQLHIALEALGMICDPLTPSDLVEPASCKPNELLDFIYAENRIPQLFCAANWVGQNRTVIDVMEKAMKDYNVVHNITNMPMLKLTMSDPIENGEVSRRSTLSR